MRNVKEIQKDIDVRREDLGEIFDTTKADGKFDMSPEQVEKVREINDELTELGKELEDAKEMDTIYQDHVREVKEGQGSEMDLPLGPQGGEPRDPGNGKAREPVNLGKMFVESNAYKNRTPRSDIEVNLEKVDVKTLMETTAGFAPEDVRTGRIVEYAVRRPVVADLIPQTTFDQAAVVYMEETTFTNNADETAEGGSYPEGALAFTEQSETVRKIATFIPVTDEQIEDVPQAQSLINNRLTLMLMLAEEDGIISGDGSAPNLNGFLNKSGVGSQAKGSDPVPDAIYKGITTVRTDGYTEPTGIVMHPNDWQSVRLLTTADGVYIWGPPSQPGPERIWGLPVVITTAMTENTALLGDFQLFSELYRKRGVVIKVSDSHSDFFIKGKKAIRADERVTLVIYRASAFCKVTGI